MAVFGNRSCLYTTEGYQSATSSYPNITKVGAVQALEGPMRMAANQPSGDGNESRVLQDVVHMCTR
ncbi:hypothetical protein CY34DRAFT_806476 [Suillus luteus UH-Slu-Lm8-n1]|uniref:Uncharacterized protein n=1 Tax=Suillus luteus UH-Slu-Lm8-n1 TaxID=930992 RepID=A0A0C9ZT76_9AGAM|nr:hypothetical protein CY34DRAFT_806476 [Suillus luteus UH-Slu-Lm8-n1]